MILIGATTENPYFEVNGALLSRSAVFELKPLEKEDIKILLRRAVEDEEKGLGSFGAKIEEEALEFLADMSGGDARSALNAIELGVLTTERSEDGIIHITLETASECIQKRVVNYDKKGIIITILFRRLSKVCVDQIRMRQCFIWQNAVCGRRCQVYCPPHYDMRSGRCGKCRSDGSDGCRFGGTGGRADRHAGVSDYFISGSDVCSMCA